MPAGNKKPGLLVSVRSVAEAAAALEGGADLIDVKEPARGPLGRADSGTIADVVRFVGKRKPVSAALGELADGETVGFDNGLAYVKWGLAGCRGKDWRQALEQNLAHLAGPQPVFVAYADAQQAESPPIDVVVEFAHHWPGCGLLLDTFDKTPRFGTKKTLLDWLSVAAIAQICQTCAARGVSVALAGSLAAEQIIALKPAAPDWFGVRAAACAQGQREALVRADKVRALVELL